MFNADISLGDVQPFNSDLIEMNKNKSCYCFCHNDGLMEECDDCYI